MKATIAIAACVASALPASAQRSVSAHDVVVAQYGAFFPGDVRYPELALEVEQGGRLTLVNLDSVVGAHTLTERVPDGSFDEPRFSSRLTNSGETSEVEGVGSLLRGTYRFVCMSHEFMNGTLTIV